MHRALLLSKSLSMKICVMSTVHCFQFLLELSSFRTNEFSNSLLRFIELQVLLHLLHS